MSAFVAILRSTCIVCATFSSSVIIASSPFARSMHACVGNGVVGTPVPPLPTPPPPLVLPLPAPPLPLVLPPPVLPLPALPAPPLVLPPPMPAPPDMPTNVCSQAGAAAKQQSEAINRHRCFMMSNQNSQVASARVIRARRRA